MQTHRSAAARLVALIEYVAAAALGIVTLLVFASAIGRYLLTMPVPDAFDLSRLVLGVALVWGFASLGYSGSHIKVDLLAEALPRRGRRIMNAFAWLVLLGFTILLAWQLWARVGSAMRGRDSTFELRLLHWPFFAAIWAGVVAAIFTTCYRLYLILAHGRDLSLFEEDASGGPGQ
ncbi:MAG: TRAP transporter small permease [Paracoccus sp. (in: a-proteobacteria)]|nr:TRAP transporter small permease [Paracoccus sp. (in: a-proteobacteria)]